MEGAAPWQSREPLPGVLSQSISSPLEHSKWLRSASRTDLLEFVRKLCASCSSGRPENEQLSGVIASIRALGGAVERIKPLATAQRGRFGDTAFRTWLSWVQAEGAPAVVKSLKRNDVVISKEEELELAAYLCHAFGDAQRIDYGTAHETSFVIFMLAALRLKLFAQNNLDGGSLACLVFAEYLRVCRRVQRAYSLEPAGSRGAWSLDDYQCLAFAVGAAQHGQDTAPAAFAKGNDIDESTLERDSIFFESLAFSRASKTGAPFAKTSPMLHALSAKSWPWISRHVLDYYEREVLGKFIVARHIRFSSLFKPSWADAVDAKRHAKQQQQKLQDLGRRNTSSSSPAPLPPPAPPSTKTSL